MSGPLAVNVVRTNVHQVAGILLDPLENEVLETIYSLRDRSKGGGTMPGSASGSSMKLIVVFLAAYKEAMVYDTKGVDISLGLGGSRWNLINARFALARASNLVTPGSRQHVALIKACNCKPTRWNRKSIFT